MAFQGLAYACRTIGRRAAPCIRRASDLASPTTGTYPGGVKIPYTSTLDTHDPGQIPPMACFRIMDESGNIRPGAVDPGVDRDTALRIYSTMCRLQTMDNIFYDAQRQGRISFYMTNGGEEGTHLGTAVALQPDDEVFAQVSCAY